MREVTLPSGATLKVTPSAFAVSKALYQAVLSELKGVPVSASTDHPALFKDLMCTGFSSPAIEACLSECFKKCTYNCGKGDMRIDADTFEPVENRDDYIMVCFEVAKENVFPFLKSLYAEFQRVMKTFESTPK